MANTLLTKGLLIMGPLRSNVFSLLYKVNLGERIAELGKPTALGTIGLNFPISLLLTHGSVLYGHSYCTSKHRHYKTFKLYYSTKIARRVSDGEINRNKKKWAVSISLPCALDDFALMSLI